LRTNGQNERKKKTSKTRRTKKLNEKELGEHDRDNGERYLKEDIEKL
jgi:hypothetical protein